MAGSSLSLCSTVNLFSSSYAASLSVGTSISSTQPLAGSIFIDQSRTNRGTGPSASIPDQSIRTTPYTGSLETGATNDRESLDIGTRSFDFYTHFHQSLAPGVGVRDGFFPTFSLWY